MKKLAVFLLPLALLCGCARNPAAVRTALAREDSMALLCKHCNCYMPADVDPESACKVCNCGYKAARCIRGK